MNYQLLKAIVVSLFLTGCGATNIKSASISTTEKLPIDHGVVAVQVINNTDKLTSLNKGWTEVIAVRTDNMEELKQIAIDKFKKRAELRGVSYDPEELKWKPEAYYLRPNNQGVIDSQLFIGSMPKGTYMISNLHSFFTNGDVSSWVSMPVYKAAGYFEVEAKKFTNLGSIVFQPLLNVKEKSFWDNASSKKAYVTRLNNSQGFKRFITTHYPKLSESIDFNQVLSWTKDPIDEFRDKLASLSRENAYGDRVSYLESFGKGVVAARFGQLKILQENGEWIKSDLPINGQLSAVIELGQSIAVGSERGLVFTLDKSTKEWKELKPVAANEAVVWFGKGCDKHYALTSTSVDYYIYEFKSLFEPWEKIGTFKKKPKVNWIVLNGGLFTWMKDGSSLRVLNDSKLYDYNSDTQTWSSTKSNSMVKLSKLKHGPIVGVEVSQWDGFGDQVYSLDDGDTWQYIKRNLRLFSKFDGSIPTILTNNTIVTVGNIKKQGVRTDDLKIVTAPLEATGKKGEWQVHGQIQDECHTLLPELTNDQTLYFLCDQGEIISTQDLGASWKTEFDIDLKSMQDKYNSMLDAILKSDDKM